MAKKPTAPRQYYATAAVRELARIARKLRRIESSAEFLHQGKRLTLTLILENEELHTWFRVRTSLDKPDECTMADTNRLQDAIMRMIDAYLHAEFVPDTVTVRTSAEGDLSPTGIRDLLRRVWCEASGVNADAPVKPPESTFDFVTFMKVIAEKTDPGKLQRALEMLKEERFQLYAKVEGNQLVGVVRSQKKADLIYSCHLNARGRYGCCTPDLAPCWGMRGQLCKHLLVLIVGLTKTGALDAGTTAAWVTAIGRKGPSLHEELLSDTLVMYKGAEAGEIDWRPTETIPEDYFSY